MNNNETLNIEFQSLTEESTQTKETIQTQEVTETQVASPVQEQPVRVNELTQLRTENYRVYNMSDGTQQAVFYGEASPLLARGIVSAAAPMTTYSWNGSEMSEDTAHTVGITVAEDTAQVNRMYLHFEMPTLPRNPRIKKAELILYQSAAVNEADAVPRLALYRVTEDIAVGTAAPASDTVLLDYEPAKLTEEGTAQYTFDITRLVDMVNGGDSTAQNLVVQLLDESGAVNSHVTLFGHGAESAPTISITYESGYAVGGSYRAHTHQLGRFGQGSIDLARGNLMFECEDFAWGGSRMPITVRHLYNSALSDYAYTANSSIKLDTADFSAMGLGKGWKLNLMQSMVPASFQYEGTAYEGYVHTDENGQETHFKLTEGTQYESVDDSECIYDSETRTLTIGDETHLFDEAGRLTRITDAYGNTMDLTWSEGRLVTVTDGIDRSFSLTYGADNYLTAITAPDGSVMEYKYNDNGLLSQMIYPDGRKAAISYNQNKPASIILIDPDGNGVCRVVYLYNGGQIKSVTEYGLNSSGSLTVVGAQTTYTYSASTSSTVVRTKDQYNNDTAEVDSYVDTYYSFDQDGNVVGEYINSVSMENTGIDGGNSAGIHPYYGNSGVTTVSTSRNKLSNHGFESTGNWLPMEGNLSGTVYSTSQAESRSKYGRKYGTIQTTDTECMENGIYQSASSKLGWNTFSVYMRVNEEFTGETDPGAYIRAVDASGNVLAESEHLRVVDSEYVRLEASFSTNATGTVYLQILANGKGCVHVDAAQFEYSQGASRYNHLHNGGFGAGIKPWVVKNAAVNSATYFNEAPSMIVNGDLESASYICQTVPVRSARSTRETFTLSGWAKGVGLPVREREGADLPTYRLRAVITYNDANYEDTSSETFTADFSPGAEEWQYVTLQFAKSKYRTIGSVKVYCDFDYNSGTVYFDDIQLVRDSLETGLTAEDFPEEDLGVETASEEAEAEETASFEEVVDAFGNTLTETTFADGEFGTVYRSFGYDEDGNDLIRETDARGNDTVYTVDPHTSRNAMVTDRCGNQTCYQYDANGRTTKVTSKDADSVEQANVSYAYDSFDNLTEIVRGDGLKYVLGYNAFHNLESIGVDGKEESLVKYVYRNTNGRLRSVTYANGDVMQVYYNALGQLTSEKWTDASGVVTAYYQYGYDNRGNIVRSVDITAEKEYIYSYEGDRIVRNAEYDVTLNDSNIVTSKTLVNTVRYYYNAEGNLTKKRIMPVGCEEQVIHYETPEEGNTVVRFDANGQTVTSHSKTDSFGRKVFEEIQTGSGFISRQFAYHAGEVTQEHKDSDKLKSSAITNLVSQIILSDGRTLSYAYDAEERIIAVVETAEVNGEPVTTTTEYTYDAQGQLLTETVDGVAVNTMTYDGYGNILTKNGNIYHYDDAVWKDKLTSYITSENGVAVEKTITYDAQGNPTNYLGHTLTWEKGRQLKSFSSGENTYTYTYNANGIRTRKTVNEVLHTYYLDGSNILREEWNENVLMTSYDNEEQVCGIRYNNTPYFFLKNLQGDIIAITDSNGQVVARYTYDAWGKCTITQDTTEIGIATINPYRYRGYYYDTETGLYYLQSRYYDPEIGRFLNSDEASLLQNWYKTTISNLYAYCGDDPCNRFDVGGLFWSSNSLKSVLNKLNKRLLKWGINTAAIGAAFLGMHKDKYGIYHAGFDCWQQYFGYNNFYDYMFNLATSMKSAKFPFKSGKKSYILWAWKGNYINLGAGAELGVYYGGEPHWKVDKKLAMNMSMNLQYNGISIISYSKKTWWITGFNPNSRYLNARASQLKVSFTVKFSNGNLYMAFKKVWKKLWKCNDKTRVVSYTF